MGGAGGPPGCEHPPVQTSTVTTPHSPMGAKWLLVSATHSRASETCTLLSWNLAGTWGSKRHVWRRRRRCGRRCTLGPAWAEQLPRDQSPHPVGVGQCPSQRSWLQTDPETGASSKRPDAVMLKQAGLRPCTAAPGGPGALLVTVPWART